ncbi:MAG: hypothetical protein ACKVP5_13780 [Aestuariivirga sp.]
MATYLTNGNDTYFGTALGDDVFGKDGNDVIFGGDGHDFLAGGDGDDWLNPGYGLDVLVGGAGSDTVSYAFYGSRVHASLLDGYGKNFSIGPDTDTYFSMENIEGSGYDDFLEGDNNANVLKGLSGKDDIFGLGGADTIDGGNGDDDIDGGSGADLLKGGAGDDSIKSGSGADTLDGGAGRDMADYADSTIAVSVKLTGLAGVGGHAQGDTYTGIESVQGSQYGDILWGNGGGNTLRGEGGNDEIKGGGGEDTLFGGDGDNILEGESGNDTFYAGDGNDQIKGGTGIDLVRYDGSTGVLVNLSTGQSLNGEAAGDALESVENLRGSSFYDFFTGDDVANTLMGMGGNDKLSALGGNDTVIGGDGIDNVWGGAGLDKFEFRDLDEAGDTINDFVAADDTIVIWGAGFGGGLMGGSISSLDFVTRADNAAQDVFDRFVFRTTDKTLWFDVDGSGAAAAILVADLQQGATMTHADILIV